MLGVVSEVSTVPEPGRVNVRVLFCAGVAATWELHGPVWKHESVYQQGPVYQYGPVYQHGSVHPHVLRISFTRKNRCDP